MSHLVANIAPLMNEYANALYKDQIKTPIYMKAEMETLFTPIAADTYVAPSGMITDLFQACQCPPVPKGNTSFSAEEITTECGEIFYELGACELEKHWKKWQYKWHQPNTKPDAYLFAEYMYSNLLLPKSADERDNIAFWGNRVAPTTGTAGAVLGTFTGLRQRLIAGRDRSTNPIPKVDVGALAVDGSDRYDKVKAFFEGMSATMQSLPGTLYMSAKEARLYKNAKLAQYPYQMDLGSNLEMVIDDFPNKRIKGLTRMNGSSMWLFVPDMYTDNLVCLHGLGKPMIPQGFWWVTDDLALRFKAEYFRGYGFEYAPGLVMTEHN